LVNLLVTAGLLVVVAATLALSTSGTALMAATLTSSLVVMTTSVAATVLVVATATALTVLTLLVAAILVLTLVVVVLGVLLRHHTTGAWSLGLRHATLEAWLHVVATGAVSLDEVNQLLNLVLRLLVTLLLEVFLGLPEVDLEGLVVETEGS